MTKIRELAGVKRLPPEFLASLGAHDDDGAVALPYHGADGSVLFERRRTALRAKDGTIQPRGVALAPYGRERPRRSEALILVEGESDCWTLWYADLDALGVPGASATRCIAAEDLRDRAEVLVQREPDDGGEAFVAGAVARLRELAFAGRVVAFTAGDGLKDASDLWTGIADAWGGPWPEAIDEFRAAIERRVAAGDEIALTVSDHDEANGANGATNGARRSQASALISLAADVGLELFHDEVGRAWCDVLADGARETLRLRDAIRGPLVRELWRRDHRAPNAQALADATLVLEAEAFHDHQQREVHVRVAGDERCVFLDLGDATHQLVAITAEGWKGRASGDDDPRFWRPEGMLALPAPERGGSLDDVRVFLNVSPSAWPLVRGALVAAMMPRGPYPILVVTGEQGAAKSTCVRLLASIIDPSAAPLRSLPHAEDDLAIAATRSHLQVFDNLSTLPPDLADALCRLSTGGGLRKRELFTNDSETILRAVRPIFVNGIGDVTARGDFLDRALLVRLEAIGDEDRLEDAVLSERFEAARPRILGGLCDAVATALRQRDAVRASMRRKPRMADAAVWIAASEGGDPANSPYLAALAGAHDAAVALALDAAPIADPLRALVRRSGNAWSGTATELLSELAKEAGDAATRGRGWPRAANALSNQLARLAPSLRATGIEFVVEREGHARTRCYHLSSVEPPEGQGMEKVLKRSSASSAQVGDCLVKPREITVLAADDRADDRADDPPMRTITFPPPADDRRAADDMRTIPKKAIVRAQSLAAQGFAVDADDADDLLGHLSAYEGAPDAKVAPEPAATAADLAAVEHAGPEVAPEPAPLACAFGPEPADAGEERSELGVEPDLRYILHPWGGPPDRMGICPACGQGWAGAPHVDPLASAWSPAS